MSAKASTEERDPVAEALARAPIDPRPESDDERRKVAEARAGLARGERTYSQDEIEAMLEQWRKLGRPPTREERDAMLDRRAKNGGRRALHRASIA